MAQTEERNCQNCKQKFRIEPDDFAFYETIHVPPPTWCPECRMQRRFAWRNERSLHKRECDLCHKSLIALYPKETTFPVYCNACWFSDQWAPTSYGIAFDPSRSFFQQFKELRERVPRLAIWSVQCANSEYTNQSYANKNVYLSFAIRDSEDCAYCARNVEIKQCIDCSYTHHSELLYAALYTDKSYRGRFLEEAEACVDSSFISNSRNCQQCFGAVNLRSASNVFFGEQLTKGTYAEKLKSLNLGSRAVQEELICKFEELKARSIFRYANLINTVNSKGDHLSNAKNCHYVFDGFELDNVRYSSWVFTSKDISDCYGMGGGELIYECIGVEDVNNVKFSNVTDGSNNVQYTDLCSSSSSLFGCIGLRSKEYCILNRQYSKEEYGKLVAQIIDHMDAMPYVDKKGREYRYGEFFPAEFSPFAYNETIAQENSPLSREEAEGQGYSWREPDKKDYIITLPAENVPDVIADAPNTILNETIACAHEGKCSEQCSLAFRVIPQELQFYRQLDIPLPVLCPNCRHYARLKKRNPLRLWERECMCLRGGYQNSTPSFSRHRTLPQYFPNLLCPRPSGDRLLRTML